MNFDAKKVREAYELLIGLAEGYAQRDLVEPVEIGKLARIAGHLSLFVAPQATRAKAKYKRVRGEVYTEIRERDLREVAEALERGEKAKPRPQDALNALTDADPRVVEAYREYKDWEGMLMGLRLFVETLDVQRSVKTLEFKLAKEE